MVSHVLGNRSVLFRAGVLVAVAAASLQASVFAGCSSVHDLPDFLCGCRTGDKSNPVSPLLLLALAGTSIRVEAGGLSPRPRWIGLLDASVLAYVVGVADPSLAPCAKGAVLVGRYPRKLSAGRPSQCSVFSGVSASQASARTVLSNLFGYVAPDQ